MTQQLESSIPAEQQEQSINPGQFERTEQALEMDSTDPEFDDSLGNVADAAIDQKALVNNVTDDLASLQRSLIEGLFERLTKSTARLRSEAQAKSDEAATLRQRHTELAPRVAARQRVLSYEADKLISEGRDSEIPALRAEAVELEKNLTDLLQQAAECDRRVTELNKLQRERARKIFEQSFPEIRGPLVEIQRGMCGLLDGVWGGLERYQSEAGLQGSHDPYRRGLLIPERRTDLTAREKGEESNLYQQLLYWFGYNR